MERWKAVKGYEDKYLISSMGRVKSLFANRLMKQSLSKCGYLRIGLKRNQKSLFVSVHRLVAQHFINNPKNLKQVNHKDGNKQNNLKSNLQWCTPSQNTKHAIKIGLIIMERGEKNRGAKLKDKQIPIIRRMSEKHTHLFIANKFGVDRKTISCIIHHKTWTHI